MALLTKTELARVTAFLRGATEMPNTDLLAKLELGLWIFPPFPFGPMNVIGPDYPARVTRDAPPLLVAGQFGAEQSSHILRLFREQAIPYLLVRVQSWEAHINCNGEILTKHCEEDLDAMRDACEELRRQCSQKHPSVAVKP